MSAVLSVEQQVLHAYVALQHLGEGRPILEIAEELGLSRFVISRMVRKARDLGLIQVTPTLSDPLDIALSGRLAERFGLRAALVVAAPGRPEGDTTAALAAMTARFLADSVEEDDVIGVSPGRTLVAASRLVETLPSSDVVQLTGVGAPRLEDGVEAVLNLGKAAGGATFPLYAPIVADASSATMLKSHPTLRHTLQRFEHVTKAIVTIGGWPEESLLARQVAELEDRGNDDVSGVVAEVGTTLLAADGSVVPALTERLIGISDAQLRAVALCVAVGGGPRKADAVRAVLRARVADVVITDAACARFALGEGAGAEKTPSAQ